VTPIDVRPDYHLVPPGTREVVYAKDQPQYLPLPTLVTPDGRVLSQWQPDANELELLKNGAPVTLVLYTFNGPLQPIQLVVGGMDLRQLLV
jgi:hypothetical protein